MSFLLRAASALLIFASGTAWADGKRDLDDGIAFYENLDTKRALYRLTQASKAADLSPADRATAFVYLGMLKFEVGKSKEARVAWSEAIKLDRSVKIPKGTSPKMVEVIERLRKEVPEPPNDPPPPIAPVAETPESTPTDTTNAKDKTGPSDQTGVTEPPPPVITVSPSQDPKTEVKTPEVKAVDLSASTDPPPPMVDPVVTEPNTDEGTSPWLWIGIGGGVAVAAAAVVVGILFGGSAGGDCDGNNSGGCLGVTIR